MKLIYLKSAWKSDSFDVYFSIKILLLEFRLLLSQVAPYYSSLPRIVWKCRIIVPNTLDMQTRFTLPSPANVWIYTPHSGL